MKKVLILYSITGAGHQRTAEALKEEIQSQTKNVEVVLHEGLENARFGVKTHASFIYSLFSSNLQYLYNFLYLATNNKLGTKILRLFIKRSFGKSIKNAIEANKPDLIITTHSFFSRSTIHNMKTKVPFITIVTDLGFPHHIWFDKSVDKIITPTEVVASFAKKIINDKEDRVVSIDYPLKNHFAKPVIARDLTNTLLVLGGGVGSGNIEPQVKILLKDLDKKIIAVCGRNAKLYKRLKKIDNHRLQVFGFVNNLFELYSLADIVITKAGPATIVEAASLKKPLIITSWVGIQEKDNVKFVAENNLGIYQPKIKNLPRSVEEVYKNYPKYSKGNDLFSEGSKKIVKYIFNTFP